MKKIPIIDINAADVIAEYEKTKLDGWHISHRLFEDWEWKQNKQKNKPLTISIQRRQPEIGTFLYIVHKGYYKPEDGSTHSIEAAGFTTRRKALAYIHKEMKKHKNTDMWEEYKKRGVTP